MNIAEPTKNTTNSGTKEVIKLSLPILQSATKLLGYFPQMRYFEEQNNLHPPLSPSFYAKGVRYFLRVVRIAAKVAFGVGGGGVEGKASYPLLNLIKRHKGP